ncbi:type II secretion system protein N [Neisseriaceae bacterium TC5R-5]|nr:type II secretion system protein N [Neisseriaceae bacterium TC5R-5]
MGRKIALGLLCSLLFMGGLVLALPANLLSLPLRQATAERWQFSGSQGTVWSGNTQLVYVGEQGQVLTMSRIGWQFQPKAVLAGRLRWQLESDGQKGLLELGWNQLQLSGLSLTLPVAALANLSKTWQAARLGGDLHLNVAQFSRRQGQLSGGMQLSWLGASSPMTTQQPFGSYQLHINGSGPGLNFQLATLDGPLQLTGQGQWQPGAELKLAGTASSTPEQYDALKPLLLMLGQPSGPNSVNWQVRPGV